MFQHHFYNIHLYLQILPAVLHFRIQHEAYAQGDECSHHGETSHDEGRHFGNHAGEDEFSEDREEESDGNDGQDKGDDGEKIERLVVFVQAEDGHNDFDPVAHGIQLAHTACRAVSVLHGNALD